MEDLTFRNATEADSDFAYMVKKAAFRKYAEKVWGWDETDQRALHVRRFAAQAFEIIGFCGKDVGVLATVEEADCIRVYQLFILPDYQGKGIGSVCMRRIMEDAGSGEKPVRLQVLKINCRAIEFYQRLGFIGVGEGDTHIQMAWSSWVTSSQGGSRGYRSLSARAPRCERGVWTIAASTEDLSGFWTSM